MSEHLFKVVSTLEKKGVYFCTVPHQWEINGTLFWPEHMKFTERESLRSDASSTPDAESWKKFPCVLKCANIKSFAQGLKIEKTLLECVDTDAEETVFANVNSKEKKTVCIADRTGLMDIVDVNVENDNVQGTEEAEIIYLEPDSAQQTTFGLGENTLLNNNDAGLIFADSKSFENISADIANLAEEIKTLRVEHTKILVYLDKIYKTIVEKNSEIPHYSSTNSNEIAKKDLLKKFNFPLASCDEISRLNEEIQKNSNLKDELIETLAKIGGKTGQGDGAKVAYKLVDFLFKPEVLINYTWTGVSREKTVKKISFQLNEHIVEIFYVVVLLADNRHTKQKNESIFKDGILKHAKKRCSRKKITTSSEEKEAEIAESTAEIIEE